MYIYFLKHQKNEELISHFSENFVELIISIFLNEESV